MAALVSKNPDSSSDHTLNDRVQGPEHCTNGGGWDVLRGYVVVEDVEDGAEIQEIASNICKTTSPGSFEAMGRNSITNLFDGEVGDGKLVAICIQHFRSR